MKSFLTVSLQCIVALTFAQKPEKPFIRLTQPLKETNTVAAARQFIIGSSCKNCTVTVNAVPVKVYSTGAFLYELNLTPGQSDFVIAAEGNGPKALKKLSFTYSLPKPAEAVKTFGIESIETFPEGNLLLQVGDEINFKVKAMPNCAAKILDDTKLFEMPLSANNRLAGIYQGTYTVKATDMFTALKIPVTITDSLGKILTKATKQEFSVLSPIAPDIALTKGRLAHLEYGLGDDRLGGAKIGYIDSNIVLKIIGKVGTHYKVRLSKSRTAYIPDELVALQPKGSFAPESLTDKWQVYGDSAYDYVRLGLFARLPYQSFQLVDPSVIVVDVFGATNNTNWITQYETTKEIKHIDYEQLEDEVFRIKIFLKHPQHWGHQLYYKDNSLMIKIKQQPQNLALNQLVIAVDAGHGGNNTGAVGATNTAEKDITISLAIKLRNALQQEGAKVIMTRSKEAFVDNKERILFYRDSLPDLLLSLHLNSANDPLRTGGTSTYYRYIGFRNLSLDIYKRLLELGLKEYGNTGSFNFMLNSPIEYPNALIETLFLSNPEEEEKILDPAFQELMVSKIVQGLKDFLNGCTDNK